MGASNRIDVNKVLTEARGNLLDWETAPALSHGEQAAARRFTECFAVLDKEACHGNLPREWSEPPFGPVPGLSGWDDSKRAKALLYGIHAGCGAPCDVRLAIRQDRAVITRYCTSCDKDMEDA